jgi:HPt (histidine-containing phosphotransfer) domain-containing protein
MPPASDPLDHVPSDAGIDLHAALRRLGGDADLLRELAAIFVQDAAGLLDQATSALERADSAAAAHAAHSLKGLASNFSAAAADAAHAAEDALRNNDLAASRRAVKTLRTFIERLVAQLERNLLQ